jgi:hypothetical protein
MTNTDFWIFFSGYCMFLFGILWWDKSSSKFDLSPKYILQFFLLNSLIFSVTYTIGDVEKKISGSLIVIMCLSPFTFLKVFPEIEAKKEKTPNWGPWGGPDGR